MAPSPDALKPVVLVVDDAPSSLGVLCDTLEDGGYCVLVAHDGESALERLALVTPDAILLDALMPGLSGFDTCRRIKADPTLAHIPVIFMTGLSDTEHVLQGFACGGVDYVVKPVRAPEVLARLHTHARQARLARMAREAVDIAGMGVALVDARGRLAWCSPQARLWLDLLQGEGGREPDAPLAPELRAIWEAGSEAGHLRITTGPSTLRLRVRNLGRVGFGESMLLMEECHDRDESASSRLEQAALTPREAEVLSWLAKGKTNRDIGDILGLSPRTVNKHLEHAYEKLGIETRAAAAALVSSQAMTRDRPA